MLILRKDGYIFTNLIIMSGVGDSKRNVLITLSLAPRIYIIND